MKAYGPVPSRRLGKSIGVNNIPYKICSYMCVYCQIGKSIKMQSTRDEFYNPNELAREVSEVVEQSRRNNNHIDYITIVPDGEPTLDKNLGILIDAMKTLDIPVAVITNSSLLYMEEVRNALLKADYVSIKIDTVFYDTWKKLNKPVRAFSLEEILHGMKLFASHYTGKLVTETMLIRDYNDTEEEWKAIAGFIRNILPHTAYLGIPTRPPAFEGIEGIDETAINAAYQIFARELPSVEYLTGYEGNAYAASGNPKEDILSITAVHPMREDGVKELLDKTNESFTLVEKMVNEGLLTKHNFHGKNFYIRKFRR